MSLNITIIIGVVCTVIGVFAGTMFLYARKTENHWHSLWLKCLGSMGFVVTGVAGAFYSGGSFAWLTAIGLVFGFLGDLLLGFRTIYTDYKKCFFYSGGFSFSIGHIFYIIALLTIHNELGIDALISFVIMMILAFIYAWNSQKRDVKRLIAGSVYIGFVAVMASIALSAALASPETGTILFALGGISFFLSDNFLGAYSFGHRKTKALNITLHVTYYIAQFSIGWSVLFL